MRHGRRALLASTVALLLPLGACSDGGDDATTTTQPTTTTIPVAAPPELLEAGAEPRIELRPAMVAGDEVVLRLATDVVVDQDTGGRKQQLDSPPIVQLVRVEVLDADADGYQLQLTIESVVADGEGTDLDDERLAALQAKLQPLVGLTGTARFDELGRPIAIDLQAPDDLTDASRTAIDALRDQLARLAPSLPEAPVGVGARWRSPLVVGEGTDLEVTGEQTVTLTAIDGGRVSYDVDIELAAGAQDLAGGGRLTSASVTGDGSGWFELTSPAFQVDTTTHGVSRATVDGVEVAQLTTTVSRAAPAAP